MNNPGFTTLFSGAVGAGAVTSPWFINTTNATDNLIFSGAVTGLANQVTTITGPGAVAFTSTFTVSSLVMNGTGTLTLAPNTGSNTLVLYVDNSGTVILAGNSANVAAGSVNLNSTATVKFGGTVTVGYTSIGTNNAAQVSGASLSTSPIPSSI